MTWRIRATGYDADALAYFARVEGASGDNQVLETAVKDAINAFVVGCKADGIWNAIKAKSNNMTSFISTPPKFQKVGIIIGSGIRFLA